MRRMLIAAMALATAGGVQAQDTIRVSGRVVDSDGLPVPLAQVTSKGVRTATSDDSGSFRLAFREPAKVTVQASRLGYLPGRMQLDLKRDTTIEIFLVARPTALPVQTVLARAKSHLDRVGFYSRMDDAKKGTLYGVFIPPESLDARNSDRLSDVVMRVPNLRLRNTAGGGVLVTGSDGCLMTLYLDGSRFDMSSGGTMRSGTGVAAAQSGMIAMGPTGNVAGGSGKERGESFDNIIGITQLAGIEIYPRGINAPAQFQNFNGQCGIIALWTRSGAEPARFRKRDP
jgi:hypothetical protein